MRGSAGLKDGCFDSKVWTECSYRKGIDLARDGEITVLGIL